MKGIVRNYCSLVTVADLDRLLGGGAPVVLCPVAPGIPDGTPVDNESCDLSSPVVELPSSRSFSSFTTFTPPSVLLPPFGPTSVKAIAKFERLSFL